jgi:hypothetical protein
MRKHPKLPIPLKRNQTVYTVKVITVTSTVGEFYVEIADVSNPLHSISTPWPLWTKEMAFAVVGNNQELFVTTSGKFSDPPDMVTLT